MNYQLIKTYCVYEGGGERSAGEPKWYFVNKDDAEHFAQGKGWYGGPAFVAEMYFIDICGTMFQLKSDQPVNFDFTYLDQKELVNKALAKLTASERKALQLY